MTLGFFKMSDYRWFSRTVVIFCAFEVDPGSCGAGAKNHHKKHFLGCQPITIIDVIYAKMNFFEER
jgi:hypothetical protein